MPETPLLHYLRLQRGLDRDVLSALRVSAASIESELRRLEGRVGVGAAVRSHQLTQSQAYINREMARFWGQAGNTIAEHQANAAAEAAEASLRSNPTLSRLFSQADLDYMSRSTRASAAQGLETAMQRVSGASYVPLAESVYNNAALTSGKVDDIVTAALARGASAAELAKDVRGFINPNTPGGVRYASMRLGRTELNNAFHASQIQQAQKSPWVTAVMWNLSGSHPKPDECNEYADDTHFTGGEAGQFKPMEVPSKPHPNCLCYTTTVDVGRDEFIKQFDTGHYDEFLQSEFPDLPLGEIKAAPTGIVSSVPPKFPAMIEDPDALRQAYRSLARQRTGGLYEAQSEAVSSYTGFGYSRINEALRGTAEASARTKGFIKALDRELKDGVRLTEDMTVLRGVTELDLANYVPGEFVVEAGYSSTSMSKSIADRFARGGGVKGEGQGEGWIMEIRIPKGNRVLFPDHTVEEREVILSRNSKFKVHAVDVDRKRVWVEVVK